MIAMIYLRALAENFSSFVIGTEIVHFILNDEWISFVTKPWKCDDSNMTLQKKKNKKSRMLRFSCVVYRRAVVRSVRISRCCNKSMRSSSSTKGDGYGS